MNWPEAAVAITGIISLAGLVSWLVWLFKTMDTEPKYTLDEHGRLMRIRTVTQEKAELEDTHDR